MVVSAQVSVYPLGQERLSPAIIALKEALESEGLKPEIGAMSTLLTGEAELVFATLQEGFNHAATMGRVVMTVTLSNACPV